MYTVDFISAEYISKSGIASSWGIYIFNFKRGYQIIIANHTNMNNMCLCSFLQVFLPSPGWDTLKIFAYMMKTSISLFDFLSPYEWNWTFFLIFLLAFTFHLRWIACWYSSYFLLCVNLFIWDFKCVLYVRC